MRPFVTYQGTGNGKPPSYERWPHFSNYRVEGVMEAYPLEQHTLTHTFKDTVTYKYILYFPLFISTATLRVVKFFLWSLVRLVCQTHTYTHICHLSNGQSYLLSACLGLSYLPVVCSLCPRMLTDKPECVCVCVCVCVCQSSISVCFLDLALIHF